MDNNQINSAIFSTKIEELVQSKLEDSNESSAAVSLNPSYVWAKFVLTDDLPNANKQRIPKEEFSNLIRTGVFAPVKMMEGEINKNHDFASPLGVITNLKETGNKIEGIAALWSRERTDDVSSIKEMISKGDYPQLSWEVMYEDSQEEEAGIHALKNTILRAVTLVSMPAYAGRTPIFAAASKNNISEETNVEELELLKSRVAELEQTLATKETELSTSKASTEEVSKELEELRAFKAKVEEEKSMKEKMDSIKSKFASANLNKDEAYFETNKELLLGLADSALDFMITEMVAFASIKSTEASITKPSIPNVTAEETMDLTNLKSLAAALRKINK